MKIFKKMCSAITAAALAATMTATLASGMTTASAASMTAVELVEDMGLGWNLGNALDSTNIWDSSLTPSKIETAWGNVVTTEAMIKEVKKAGINTVRIPVTWWDMTGASGIANMDNFEGTVAEEYLARVKEIVDYCIDNGMYAIINTHHDEDWEKNTSNLSKFETLWTQIATYFKDYDEHLVFEGMNEVSFSTSDAMTYNQSFVDTVRATGGNNKTRLLICTADSNNTAKALSDSFSMPDDSSNMLAVSVHYYEPSTFCVASTDSTWGYSSTWGTASDYNTLESDFNKLKTKFVDSGVGVVIGEYGVTNADLHGIGSTTFAKDQESIEKFYKAVASTAYNMEGICPVAWDDSDSGTVTLFSRKNMSWYDDNIKQIFMDVAAGGSSSTDKNKVDRLTFTASDIADGDDLLIDLKPYKDAGVNLSSVVIDYTISSSDRSSYGTGGAVQYNIIDGNGETQWAYQLYNFTCDETVTTVDIPLVTQIYDDNGDLSYEGEMDMDYLKIGSWYTWTDPDKGTVDWSYEKVTLIFDDYFYVDGDAGSSDSTTTTPATTTAAVEETTATTTTTTTTASAATPSGDPIGKAYFIGALGTASNWSEGDDDGAEVVEITGDGTYSVTWDVTGGGTDTVQFLAVNIAPDGDAENFTTDTFKDLSVTLDEVWIDGVQLTDYVVSSKAINTRYYDGDAGVTRIYLRDDWSTKIADLASDTTVTQGVKVVFTVSGTGIEGGSTEEVTTTTEATTVETTTTATTTTTASASTPTGVLYGDVNQDGKVDITDAVLANKAAAGAVELTDAARENADCDGDGQFGSSDAVVLMKFLVHLVDYLPYEG